MTADGGPVVLSGGLLAVGVSCCSWRCARGSVLHSKPSGAQGRCLCLMLQQKGARGGAGPNGAHVRSRRCAFSCAGDPKHVTLVRHQSERCASRIEAASQTQLLMMIMMIVMLMRLIINFADACLPLVLHTFRASTIYD